MVFFLSIMFLHWIADFICQTDWQAKNKSKNWFALGLHVINYTVVMSIGFYLLTLILGPYVTLSMYYTFLLVTFVTHFVTDAITSRVTAYLYQKNDIHNFFVVVGMDQFIHYLTLAATLRYVGAI